MTMPRNPALAYAGYYNCSAECWDIYAEVLGREFSTPYIYGNAHQMTVDCYAVQHAGGPHPDKSVAVHLIGLYLALAHNIPSPELPAHLQRMAASVTDWPHFPPPPPDRTVTVLDVALAADAVEHVRLVREWGTVTWSAWSHYHSEIIIFARQFLPELA
jgi:hypothetical protein